MTTVHEITDVDLNHWNATTRLFVTDDGNHFVVEADLADYPTDTSSTYIRRPTVVFYCTPQATVASLDTPDAMFTPGATAEQVIPLMNYTLEE